MQEKLAEFTRVRRPIQRKTPIALLLVVLSLWFVFRDSPLVAELRSPSKPLNVSVPAEILSSISNDSIATLSRHYYLSGPHLMGENWALADHTRSLLAEYGLEASIEEYEVLKNLPGQVSVRVLNGSHSNDLNLQEDVRDEDPTTGSPDRTPIFHGYSADGNVTGRLVYANYGSKQDFDELKRRGYNLTGTIALCRYGGLFRGLKVKFAEQAGAAGVLIYSDPKDDGKYTEENGYKPYPEGPARNPSSVQRGSVQDMGAAPGDPSTPGYPSVPGADRKTPKSIPKIPSIPLNARTGEALLKLLSGEKIKGWKGSLDAEYAVGPSDVKIELVNQQDYEYTTIHNVIGTIPGKYPDEIIIGNHRDAWILGGADPNSGTATMLELARVLGTLYKKGWKPERTIKFASWDGEEYGMVGSTEWGEQHAGDLIKNAVAYLNVDLAYSGTDFSVSASPTLKHAIAAAAKQVPFGHEDLYEYWLECSSKGELKAPGSGSDYVVFLDHLGIPSLDVEFEEGKDSPVYHYHSNFDSYHWQTTYGDVDFQHQAAIAKFLGLVVEDLASSSLYPLRIRPYADLLTATVEGLVKGRKDQVAEQLEFAVSEFHTAAKHYDSYLAEILDQYENATSWWQRVVAKAKIGGANRKLKAFERNFLERKGLPGRKWYKHIVFAPGRYTGYAGQILPALAEAIEDGNERVLSKWATLLCEKLCAISKKLGSGSAAGHGVGMTHM